MARIRRRRVEARPQPWRLSSLTLVTMPSTDCGSVRLNAAREAGERAQSAPSVFQAHVHVVHAPTRDQPTEPPQ